MSDDEWFVSFYQPATKPTTHIALVIHPMIYKYPILYSYSGLRLIVVINIHQYPIKRWMEESFAPVDDVTNPIDIGCQPSRCRTYSIHSITTAGPFPMISSRRFEYWPLGRTWKAIQWKFDKHQTISNGNGWNGLPIDFSDVFLMEAILNMMLFWNNNLQKKIRQNMFDSWRRYKHRWQGQAWISEFVPQVICHQLQSSHTKPYTNILDINQNQFLQSVKWWLLKLLMH